MKKKNFDRRKFMEKGGILLGSIAASGIILPQATLSQNPKAEGEQGISPVEDLMREHGILARILLVYEEGVKRIKNKEEADPGIFFDAAKVIREFVEDYHEMQEEQFLFPRFREADKHRKLVDILLEQHNAGRIITSRILNITKKPTEWNLEKQWELAGLMSAHMRMYRPHEAWEDTVLFPAFKKLVSKNEYESLAESFEKKEHQIFGEGGFERYVEKAGELEKRLGIHDLGLFTPDIK